LSWRDKLLAYPAYDPHYTRFFEGAFAISTTQYYAAVQAMLAFYAGWPEEFLESRKTFFLFVHIAYNLALGRKPASSHPLIVWARHSLDNGHLAEDFLDAKFVHTVRDPISSCDAYFHYFFDALPERHIMLPYTVLHFLIKQDRPQSGMERRTRTVRLEDMHGDTAQTMRDLADWLGLRYQEILLDSTFNGIAYVVKRDGVAWSGQRVEQMQRQSRHISRKDRALLFALFYENFRNWNYPCPKVFRYPIVRCSVAGWLGLWPMKMEIAGARAIFQRRILTHLRRGNILGAIKSLLGIGFLRVKIIGLLVSNVFRRSARPPAVLQLRYEKHAQGREGGVEGLETTYERS
jgi:hypothetical protein